MTTEQKPHSARVERIRVALGYLSVNWEDEWDRKEAALADLASLEEQLETVTRQRDDELRRANSAVAKLLATEETLSALVVVVRISADENDYCLACDCHPSHGHGSGCPVAYPAKERP